MTLFEDHQASNNSSSCKRNKLELIDDYLLSTGFKRNPICKDGSCLFRAVAEQLFKTQKYHVSVREACVRYMKRHQHLFENFVDNSFDDYLHKMMNPKEWADQLEISALSKMYSCDFYIYDQPGHEAKNVTDNGYSKHVYLCQSGQRHYDSVFPITKFESFGFCQALIYDMLLLRVFGTTATERNKIMTTFRMLNCKESDDNVEEFYPSERIYEPSIGLTTEGEPDVFLPETKPTQSPAPVAAFSNFKSPNLASSNVNELPAPSGHNGYHPPIDPPTYQELFPNASKTPSSQKMEVPVAANVQDVTIKAALFPPLSDPGKSSLPLSTTSHVEESDDFADFVAAAPSPGASFATDMTSPEDDSWASFQSPVPPVAPTTNLSSNNNDNSSSWGVFQSEPKPTTSGTDAPSFLQPTPAAGDKYAALKDFEMAL